MPFDLFGIFKVRIIAETDKIVTVRYPTDDEWVRRVRATKTFRKSLGRKRAEFTPSSTGAFDAELFKKIRSDASIDLDEFESTHVIDRLDRTEVLSTEREGRVYVSTFKTFGGSIVSHSLRIPTEKAVRKYYDQSGKTTFEARNSEIRSYLEPSGPFYDEHFESATGYVIPENKTLLECVPINHKSVIISEMLMTIQEASQEDADIDPNL